MRKLMVVAGLLAVLLFAAAMPAFASDGDLLGSGAVAPAGGEAAAPVTSAPAVTHVRAAGEDVLAATGLDSGLVLLIGLSLCAVGGATVLTARKRAKL